MSVTDDEVVQYLESALWTSTDQNQDPLDQHHNWEDFSGAAQRQARAELELFWNEAVRVIDALERNGIEVPDISSWPHDFWLTRNGHGAGFWDREERYGEAAEPLSELARRAGERWVEVDRRFIVRWEGNEAIEEENVELIFL